MADSDEYDSDDAMRGTRGVGSRKAVQTRPKEAARARWEEISRNWDLSEGADGNIESVIGGLEEANKRKRLQKDTTPLQRGIIRHTLLILDLSSAMTEKDLRPTRFLLTLTYCIAFVREYFEQNPISQLGILGMRDGLSLRISDMSGNPNDHINALKTLRTTEPLGNPSLQNALDMARAALYHTPSHGTREAVIILGALLTSDPGDIHETIRACVRDKIRVSIIGLAARLHICAEICRRTNAGDESSYAVALDEVHYRDLLMGVTTPPVVRGTDAPKTAHSQQQQQQNAAALLMMGFPSRITEKSPTLCACHGNLTRGGYLCSRCKAKICSLPATCPTCDLTLILSTHLARSYHHLFPLRGWLEEPEQRHSNDAKGKGASESSRYECESCQRHFCVDCDVFCHEVVHNCPGCQSTANLPGTDMAGLEERANGNGHAG
ncbi:hypothetical protein H2203_006706 [Taxawa tesnikishii (nom. ined.)]|nr:hypothetical protein H2203_006706 [Dothideales sp. JES 119]